MKRSLILADAAQIVTPVSRSLPQRGDRMGKLKIWKNASLSIDIRSGTITAIGPWKKIRVAGAAVIDTRNHVILPGFVDSHTHPIYAGSRVDEFSLRARGKPYMEILKKGGGILSTVKATRKAPGRELLERAEKVFDIMLRHGTTTVEAKTGYGLSTKEEIRQLRILRTLQQRSAMEIFITFLGAHAVPPEFFGKNEQYVDLVCEAMLPAVARRRLADFCDVFCEKGVFSVSETKRILEAAKRHGIGLRLHADEFESIGGAELGAKLGALSVDHLMGISEAGIRALASCDTAAVLLPCTSFFLGKNTYAPARKLIDKGAIVAIATDFNAGSNLCFSMQMAVSLAILRMQMSPAEAVVAATLHGAHALGQAARIGSLHPGKQADLLLFPGKDYREIFYRYGTNQVASIIKKGKVV